MARVRGGNTGFAVALVIFGCGFVISLLVAIIFYTKIEEHKAAQIAAEETLADFITSNETVQANDFKSNNATVFTNMLVKIRDFEAELREANDDVTRLDREKKEMEAQFATLDGLKKALEEANKVEAQRYKETMEERKAAVDKALRENATLATQIAEMQTKLNKFAEDADAAARDRIAELTEQLKGFEDAKIAADAEAAKWERLYKQLLASLPKPPPVGTTNPDGAVASVFGQGNDLFIDLGRKDGLVMGMTFEVFDPQPVIRLSATDEARGKATVEVYGLQDDAATCRVVRRTRGSSLNPGDPIVNVAYDPNMIIKMFAFGSFDIERDGGTNDIGRIEAIIKESGAELIEVTKTDAGIPVLTPDINYIVLGAKPELPEKPGDEVFDPVVIAEYQAKLAANEAYFRIVDEAKIMRIPVLSQDRFLDLVGYYER
ncbi:MAG: hypothetical protein KTR15_09780 [Phycisphaeraceae bacterium]|nr:hypothetical protein [Phycisphaeraceae bacterium]